MSPRKFGLCAAALLIAGGCQRSVDTRVTPVSADASAQSQAGQSIERQIVRRGNMRVTTPDVAAAQARAQRVAATLEAEIARAEVRQADEATFVFRVPSKSLEPMMDSLALVGEVKDRTISAQDVTEAVVDAEARLVSLKASRDRLRQLLERATTVQDVMAVERELARVQGDIESLEARIAALRSQVTFAELSLQIKRKVVLGPLGVVATGLGAGVGKLFVWR
jgi:hypothetical protein